MITNLFLNKTYFRHLIFIRKSSQFVFLVEIIVVLSNLVHFFVEGFFLIDGLDVLKIQIAIDPFLIIVFFLKLQRNAFCTVRRVEYLLACFELFILARGIKQFIFWQHNRFLLVFWTAKFFCRQLNCFLVGKVKFHQFGVLETTFQSWKTSFL